MSIPPPTRAAPSPPFPPVATRSFSLDSLSLSDASSLDYDTDSTHEEKSAHAILIGVLGVLCRPSTREHIFRPESEPDFAASPSLPRAEVKDAESERKPRLGRAGRVKTRRRGSWDREPKGERVEREKRREKSPGLDLSGTIR